MNLVFRFIIITETEPLRRTITPSLEQLRRAVSGWIGILHTRYWGTFCNYSFSAKLLTVVDFVLRYLHFTSLTLLLLLFLSITILFVTTLFTDITDRLLSLSSEIQLEILACAKAYVDNHCDAPTRIPMSEQACSGWERCMSRDNRVQGKARVAAEVLAEIVNGFVEVISIRTMV